MKKDSNKIEFYQKETKAVLFRDKTTGSQLKREKQWHRHSKILQKKSNITTTHQQNNKPKFKHIIKCIIWKHHTKNSVECTTPQNLLNQKQTQMQKRTQRPNYHLQLPPAKLYHSLKASVQTRKALQDGKTSFITTIKNVVYLRDHIHENQIKQNSYNLS